MGILLGSNMFVKLEQRPMVMDELKGIPMYARKGDRIDVSCPDCYGGLKDVCGSCDGTGHIVGILAADPEESKVWQYGRAEELSLGWICEIEWVPSPDQYPDSFSAESMWDELSPEEQERLKSGEGIPKRKRASEEG